MSDDHSSIGSPELKTTPEALAQIYSVDSILNIQRDLGGAITRLDRMEKDIDYLQTSVSNVGTKVESIANSLKIWKLAGGIIGAIAIFLLGLYAQSVVQFLAELNDKAPPP